MKRKRFDKAPSPIDRAHKDIQGCISDTFLLFEPWEAGKLINSWLQCALTVKGHVYDEAAAREDLIDFCGQLNRLVEAFYALYKSEWATSTGDYLNTTARGKQGIKHNPLLLPAGEEIASPRLLIKSFCATFSLGYAQQELWDLLDAVFCYTGPGESHRADTVLLFRCISSMVKIAYRLDKWWCVKTRTTA